MPRFDFNPSNVSAGFQVFPKGTYELILGEPKSFYGQGKNGKADNYGVMFVCKIAEGEFKDKKFVIRCYQHNEESKGFSKQIQMAALGFDKKQEDEFNKQHGNADWSFNTDDASAGDGWHLMKGQSVLQDMDVGMGPDGNEQQKTTGIRPFRV